MPDDPLLTRWLALWARLGAKADAEQVHADLVARHAEPHRAYHTLEHVEHCLAELDAARHLATYPDEIEWAIWFHDAILDPRRPDNEARSAELARQTALAADIRKAAAKRVYHLILATQHRVLPTDPNQQLIADIDLASLAAPWEQFAENTRRLRSEHSFLSDDAFRAGCVAFFERLLARPSLYATAFFQARCEEQARANMERATSGKGVDKAPRPW